MAYVYQAFPKHVTHADGRTQIVADDRAWQALGPGWGHPSETAVPVVPTHDDMAPAPRKKGRA